MTRPVTPGCAVRITSPDKESGISCILAGYDTAYLVSRVEPGAVFLKPHIPAMLDEVFVFDWEVTVVDEKPWMGN